MSAKVICLCGKIGSGKTTVAEELAKELGAVVFNLDKLMEPLFGQTLGRERYVRNLAICRDYVYDLADQLLRLNTSVIFDFGFWDREDRLLTHKRFGLDQTVFVYFPIDDREQWNRVSHRNNSPLKTYEFTEEMLVTLNRFFEVPVSDEGIKIIISDGWRSLIP